MKAWIEDVDSKHEAIIHAADARDLHALAEVCKAEQNAGMGNGKDMKLVMRADVFTIMKWCNERGVTYGRFMREPELQSRFIDDPDNAAFRVWKGRV